MNTLLHIVIVHHPGNEFATHAEKAARRVFGADSEEAPAASSFAPESIWNSVRVTTITSQPHLDALQLAENERALWILLVDYPMTDGPDWPAITTAIGQRLEADALIPERDRLEVLLWGEPGVVSRLPATLREHQAKAPAQLGENRLAPHRLALLALHRARLLLGRNPEANPLGGFSQVF